MRDNFYVESFSVLTQDLSLKGATGTYWRVLMLLRWTLVSSVLVFLRNHSDFQIITNLILSGLYTCLMLNNPPYADPSQNKIMLFNELMTSVYLYTLYAMTDYNMDKESKETFGIVLFGIVLGTISINILIMLYAQLTKACKFLKRKFCFSSLPQRSN